MERFAGRYALLRPLGKGGMGEVWLALDVTTGAECALKCVRRAELRPPSDLQELLRREFQILTHVRHPAVVAVHDLGFGPDGLPFYTMEYMPGQAADAALAGAGWAAVYETAARITVGLEALHSAGIAHGDIKPSNILVARDESRADIPVDVRLLDFGLAAVVLWQPGTHIGTPGYAAPEVKRGFPISIATDLYGLGATLCVLAMRATRRDGGPCNPPEDSSAAAIALEEAGAPAGLAQLVVRLLSASPEARPADAREVRLELARLHPIARQSLPERLGSERLVGRGAELARLERWLASPDVPPVVLLAGESGVGRSTLLREIEVRAQLAGRAVVALGKERHGEPGAAARTLLLRLASAAEAVSGVRDHAHVHERVESGPIAHESDLSSLLEPALAWAGTAGRDAGAPLVTVDDFEQIDPVSRALLRRLATHDGGDALRWIWSSATLFGGEGAEQLLIEAGIADPLPLGPFDRETADRLLAARLQTSPPAELADAVWSRCGGHPGLTVEVLQIAARAGALRESESGLMLDRAQLARLALPETFAAACLERLGSLSAGARASAHALAVWGMPVRTDDVLAIESLASAAGLDELEHARLLHRDAEGWCSLQPPALAHGLLATVPPADRERMHRAALERPSLTEGTRFRLLQGAGELAEALNAADRAIAAGADFRLAVEAAAVAHAVGAVEAATWETRAGRMLIERGRYREAMPHLEQAIELAPGDPALAARQVLLSNTYLRTGSLEQLDALLSKALAGTIPDRERALMLVNRCALHIASGDLAGAKAVAEEALSCAQAARDGEAEGLAHLGLASLALREVNGSEAAVDHARQSSENFARAGHVVGRLRAAVLISQAHWAKQQHAEAEALLREALEEAQRRELRLPLMDILRMLALLLLETGAWSESRLLEEQGLRIAIEEGWPAATAVGLSACLLGDALAGRTVQALRGGPRALRLVRRHQRDREASTTRALAMALRSSGRLVRAVRLARRAVSIADAVRNGFEMQWCRIEMGRSLARLGRWDEACDVWEAGRLDHPAEDSIGSCVLSVLVGRAEVRKELVDAAAARLSSVEGWLAGHRAPYVLAHALQLRAEILLARGDTSGAIEAVSAALNAFDRLPATPDAGAAALDAARLAATLASSANLPLGEWLHRAATAFEQVGDRPGRQRALAHAVDWYRKHGTTKPAATRDLLRAVGDLIERLPDPSELTRMAMRLAVEQLAAERGMLLFLRGEGAEETDLEEVVAHGTVDAAMRRNAQSYSKWVVNLVRDTGKAVVISDALSEDGTQSKSVHELGLRSILCVPLVIDGRVAGAVYLDDTRRPEAFGEAERMLLEGFAQLLSSVIATSRGHARIRRQNEHLAGENQSLRKVTSEHLQRFNLVGSSAGLKKATQMAESAAQVKSPVLVTGESGTGKEHIARMLHYCGPRAPKPFISVNSAQIEGGLAQSGLFGIRKGKASAVDPQPGAFLEANAGTLFFDEIADLPMAQQALLLRVLTDGMVAPAGEPGRAIPVDVRVVAATNRNLRQMIKEGTFRQDLYFRLRVVQIELPPLRERRADIPALAQHLVAVVASEHKRKVPVLSAQLMSVLMQSNWPGNVRELRGYLEHLLVFTAGNVLYPEPLPPDILEQAAEATRSTRNQSLKELGAEFEMQLVREALDRHAGNQTQAAKELGISENALRYRLKRSRERARSSA